MLYGDHPLQELDKLLPKQDSQDEADLDRPAQPQVVQAEGESEQQRKCSIKFAPLARPYISFGPDIRQHPCAMSTKKPGMYGPALYFPM